MNKKTFIILTILLTTFLSSALAQESGYVARNRNQNWARTTDRRLVRIINNPEKFNPEEYVAALHEYSKRHGAFARARNSLQARVNAYIAFNPDYKNQSTGDIFVWTARSRGVRSLQVPANKADNNSFNEDIVSNILAEAAKKGLTLELTNQGTFDNGADYDVYRINDNISITVSTDANGVKYMIGNVKAPEAMYDVIRHLTGIFSKPLDYLNGGTWALFRDNDNLYIKENMSDYIGTFTVYGSQLFVEEVLPKDKVITQRQWCTPDFYDKYIAELGPGWGFLASWDDPAARGAE